MTTTQALKRFAVTTAEPTRHLLSTEQDFQDAIDLIDLVRHSLTPEQQFYLLPKTMDFMKDQKAQGNAILGLRTDTGDLIGLTIVRKMHNWTDLPNFEGLPLIGFLANEAPCLLQSVCTHPKYRTLGLADRLLTMAEGWAQVRNRSKLVARIVFDNTGSRNAFMRNNYDVLSEGIDPQDGYAYIYAGKTV